MDDLKSLVFSPPLKVTYIVDDTGLDKLQDFFTRCFTMGWDIETKPLKDFWFRKIRLVQFGNLEEQYVVDLFKLSGDINKFNTQGNYGKNLDPVFNKFLEIVKPVVCSDKYLKVGVNLSFEYLNFYWNLGLRTFHFWDCTIAEKCIWAGAHSLKDYWFYGMEGLGARYFGVIVDKKHQESFTDDKDISIPQLEYAAGDTRFPLAIMRAQQLVAKGYTKKNHSNPIFKRLPDYVTGDNLEEIIQIENDCIGAFTDMHLHGENLDKEKWLKRIDARKIELKEVIKELDKVFVPIVGKKQPRITQEEVDKAKEIWQASKRVSDEELELRGRLKKDLSLIEEVNAFIVNKNAIEAHHKEVYADLKHRATQGYKKEYDKYEGEAAINYGSQKQLLEILKTFPKFKLLRNTDDTTLEKHEGHPLIDLIRKYRQVSKEIDTYGVQWVTKWVTKPGEEGWLHPMDGKLHSIFNQYGAETGRSSSDTPNEQNIPKDKNTRSCFIVDPPNEEYPEGYDMLTIDMSGAELCILAEESKEPVWVKAFNKKQDVHSLGCEIVDSATWKELALPDCLYYKDDKKLKCTCKSHLDVRDGMKSTNFGLPYGIQARKLSGQIKKSYKDTLDLLDRHKKAFPVLWEYLEDSGKRAKMEGKSFDMYGRRRIFIKPTWEKAKEKAIANLIKLKKPPIPDVHQVGNAFNQITSSIERQGKNHRIQACNATIIKIAMGTRIDGEYKYLWHVLPQYGAKLLKMVHDELVIQIPKRYSKDVAELCQIAIRKAAAIRMKLVTMESEYNIAEYWKK